MGAEDGGPKVWAPLCLRRRVEGSSTSQTLASPSPTTGETRGVVGGMLGLSPENQIRAEAGFDGVQGEDKVVNSDGHGPG